MGGRWVTSLMQCMLLSCAACMIAVAQTLKDAGCGGLGAVFSGTCDVHTPAQQTIRMAVPLPEGGWGGEAQVRCSTPRARVTTTKTEGRWHRWGNAQASVGCMPHVCDACGAWRRPDGAPVMHAVRVFLTEAHLHVPCNYKAQWIGWTQKHCRSSRHGALSSPAPAPHM